MRETAGGHRAILQRWPISLVLMIAALAILPPAPVMADTLIKWSQQEAGTQKDYSVDGLRLHLISNKNDDEGSLNLTVISANGAKITIYGSRKYLPLVADLLITHLDPQHSKIDAIFGVFTGGAHCCEKIKILSLIDNKWRVIDLGLWDGDWIPEPQAVNGKVVLAFPDNDFLYAFASYAESAMPLKILRVENGRVADESANPDFASLNRENMIENQKLCAQGGNGGCAAYVAAAARLGLLRQAWNFMLDHYDRHSGWQLGFCAVPAKDRCVRAVTFASFPKALVWFLRKYGYLPLPGSGAEKAPARAFRPGTTMP
ncbi:MAG: hypothetical protein ACREFK_05250 [Stellaceae bacterium]